MASISLPVPTSQNPTSQTIVIACPNCRAKYKVNASMQGKTAACKKCEFQMPVVPVSTKPRRTQVQAPPTNVAKARSAEKSGCRRAGLGLILKASSDILMAASLGILLPITFLTESLIPAYAFMALMGVSSLLAVIGLGLCFCIPREAKSRGYLTVSVLSSIAVATMVYGFGMLNLVAYALIAVSFLSFMLFLRKTARRSRRHDLAILARNIMWVQIAAGFFALTAPFLTLIPSSTLAFVTLILSVVNCGVLIINAIVAIVLQMKLGVHLKKMGR